MLSINKARTILNANNKEKLSDKEVKQVLRLIESFAVMSVEAFKNSEV
jgi:hypothetical protein